MAPSISDDDRERAAGELQRACGEGRLTLEEFSVRVGAVWAADTSGELERATGGLARTPVVGAGRPVERIVTVFSEHKRVGRWRLPGRLRTVTVFGATVLDLRDVPVGEQAVTVQGGCVFGQLTVVVPEGVEVETAGRTVFGSRTLRLAPVPRRPGTPLIRVEVDAWFAAVEVRSRRPRSDSPLARLAPDPDDRPEPGS